MKFKIDEDLPRVAVSNLRSAGHDAISVAEQKLSGIKDPDLWRIVQSEERILITADKGFGDIRFYPPGEHHGIVLLRPADDGIRPILELVRILLQIDEAEKLQGTICVITPRGIRIRRASN
jgi:predicted nuclease of predicted toxin-antitoxin system